MSTIISLTDEFKGHSLLQAAREADLAKVKKTLALEIINFKQPQSHETALVRCCSSSLWVCAVEAQRMSFISETLTLPGELPTIYTLLVTLIFRFGSSDDFSSVRYI